MTTTSLADARMDGLHMNVMSRPLVLIVEDEPGIAESLHFFLARDGYATSHVETLAAARAFLTSSPVALIILDLGLPDGSGEDLLRELRVKGRPAIPVLVLTSRDGEIDRIVGLELGADDYVTKPFSPREVAARVKAVLRRAEHGAPPSAGGGGLVIDQDKRRATFNGQEIVLTRTEFDLLASLCARPGHVLSRDGLLDRVWGDVNVTDRTVDAHIKSLRKRLREAGADPELIETVRGVGYRARE